MLLSIKVESIIKRDDSQQSLKKTIRISASYFDLLYISYKQIITHLRAGKSTGSQVALLRRNMRADIEVEDIHWQPHRCTCVRYVYDTGNMTLYRCTRQQQVDLIIVVP